MLKAGKITVIYHQEIHGLNRRDSSRSNMRKIRIFPGLKLSISVVYQAK